MDTCAFSSSARHGLDVNCSAFRKTVCQNNTGVTQSLRAPSRFTVAGYFPGEKKRLKVKTLSVSDTVQESTACTQFQKNFLQSCHGRHSDILEPTTRSSRIGNDKRNTWDLCRNVFKII